MEAGVDIGYGSRGMSPSRQESTAADGKSRKLRAQVVQDQENKLEVGEACFSLKVHPK